MYAAKFKQAAVSHFLQGSMWCVFRKTAYLDCNEWLFELPLLSYQLQAL